MASFLTPLLLARRRIVTLRTVVAAVAFTGAAGVSALVTSGCAVSEAHAQSAPQASPIAATSRPAIIAASQNSSTTQALLHQANAYASMDTRLARRAPCLPASLLPPTQSADAPTTKVLAASPRRACPYATPGQACQRPRWRRLRGEPHDEMQEALDDDPGNAVAQRMIPRIERQYRLITAVDDINQPAIPRRGRQSRC